MKRANKEPKKRVSERNMTRWDGRPEKPTVYSSHSPSYIRLVSEPPAKERKAERMENECDERLLPGSSVTPYVTHSLHLPFGSE